MTVALIAHYLGLRLGIGQYFQRLLPPLAEELSKNGVEFKILASPNALEKTPALQELKDVVRVVPPLDYLPSQRFLWCVTRFKDYCDREGIDAIVWLSNPIILPWHPASLAVIHDVEELKDKEKYGSRLKTTLRSLVYLNTSINCAQKLVAVSETTKKDLLHFRPYTRIKQKLKTISNGADSPLLNLPPVTIDASNHPFLLFVGRIDPQAKGLPQAVELVSKLRDEGDRPWELHLMGSTNTTTEEEGAAFLESIEELSWVTYHGYVEDEILAQWYRQATAIVFLAKHEGFGFPIAEAASFGRWVIIDKDNQAGIALGKEAIIAIDPQELDSAADKILSRLKAQESPHIPSELPTWQEAAIAYAEEIKTL